VGTLTVYLQRTFARRNGDRTAGCSDRRAADESVGGTERQTTHLVVAQFVLDFKHEIALLHRRSAELDPTLRRRLAV